MNDLGKLGYRLKAKIGDKLESWAYEPCNAVEKVIEIDFALEVVGARVQVRINDEIMPATCNITLKELKAIINRFKEKGIEI